jgi:predicted TIM-barrel fold metal-dependent hydrolase
MKIDIFNHVLPPAYLAALERHAGEQPLVRYSRRIRALWDVEERLRRLAPWPDLQQVLTLGQPTPELAGGPDLSPELARLANDGMFEIVQKHPDLFPAFVASLPMNNVPAALEEMDRAIAKLGAKGVQIFTNVNGRPLDEPEFFRIFERMSKTYDLPVWVHPTRTAKFADYATEQKSKYEIWWLFGWPYETSAFMARLVFSGTFEKLPKLKIITHHLGAMAPYFVNRIGYGMDQLGSRTSDEDYESLLKRMKKRPVDYFRMFCGDTSVNGSKSAIRCGLDFYGANRVLFGTDCPFDPEGGPLFIRETIKALDGMKLKPEDRRRIYFGNALQMLKLKLPQPTPRTERSRASRADRSPPAKRHNR